MTMNSSLHNIALMSHKFILKIILISAVITILANLSFGQMIYLPANDILMNDLEYLQARGYLADLKTTEKPWLLSTVIESLQSDSSNYDELSKQIAKRALHRLAPPQQDTERQLSADFNFGIQLRSLSREFNKGYFYEQNRFLAITPRHEFGSIYQGGFWFSKNNSYGIDSKLIFDSDGILFPQYYGTAHAAKITGQFDHAYMTFRAGRFDLFFGRQRIQWGPSPRGGLLIDKNIPPMDMIKLDFNLKPFTLSMFSSKLEDYWNPSNWQYENRYLSGHRLRINPGKGWEIAASEVYLYGGLNRMPEIYYNIPVVLYYWEAQNRGLDDNAFWSLDISWIKKNLGRFYGQFVIDDFQRKNRGPQKFAYQFGANLAPKQFPGWSALLEYNIVDTYVFGHRDPINVYMNWGKTIGRLDSDQNEYFAAIYKNLYIPLRLGVEFVGRKKGMYDAVDHQPSDAFPWMPFPMGVAEYANDISLVSEFHGECKFDASANIGYQFIKNYMHQDGRKYNQLVANIKIGYRFDTGLPFWTKYR